MCDGIKLPVICMEKTGTKLKRIREEKGYTRKELASLINASYQTVSNWEAGRKLPSIDKMVLLSSLYNVHMENLLHIDYLKGYNKNEAPRSLGKSEDSLVVNFSSSAINDWSDWIFYDKEYNVANGEYITQNCMFSFHDGFLSVVRRVNGGKGKKNKKEKEE